MLALAPPIPNHTPSPHNGGAGMSRSKPNLRKSASSSNTSTSTSSSSGPLASTSASRASLSSSHSAPSGSAESSRTHRKDSASHFGSTTTLVNPVEPTPHKAPPVTARGLTQDAAVAANSSQVPNAPYPHVDIHAYPSADLLRLLAHLLNEIATKNDALAPHVNAKAHQKPEIAEHSPIWKTLTTASRTALSTPSSHLTFHARNIPSISLEAYLQRILRYCPTTNEVFLSLLVYFDRMTKLADETTGTRFAIDSYNVHRLVIAGVTVASKFFSDVFYTNSRYAKVGGLPQAELNQLELQFLLLNDFQLVVSAEEMQLYADHLVIHSESRFKPEIASNPAYPVSAATLQATESAPPPSRPMQSMGAFDAYGGSVIDSDARRNNTPRRMEAGTVAPHVPTSADAADREADSTMSETETDAETDDEPTIRPTHSCASSETQSLYSTDASEDVDDDGEDEEESPRARPVQTHRWSGGRCDAADRSMGSP